MTATGSEPIHLGAYRAAWNRVAVHEVGVRSDDAGVNRTGPATVGGRIRAIGLGEDVDVNLSLSSRTMLMDGVMLLGVVLSLPVGVLIVGTPVALAIAFLLWLVRLALRAF